MVPLLIATVGLPRAGKSSWARRQQGGYRPAPIVSPDAIRLGLFGRRFEPLAEPHVWATAGVMVRALFHAGHERVILDACNATRKRRSPWYTDPSGLYRTQFIVFPTNADECRRRATDDGREDLLPVIDRMLQEFEPLGEGEAPYLTWEATGVPDAPPPPPEYYAP